MPKNPVCGYTLDGVECQETGEHFCVPRANHAQAFFEELLFHTKGRYVRKRFILADWQREDIIRPLFGRVVWSDEYDSYKRRYEIAWLEVARKALSVDTPIFTENRGWTRIGDMRVGDAVFNREGQPEAVDFVSDFYTEDAYRVSTQEGRSLVAGADHDWIVRDCVENTEFVVTTAEIAADLKAGDAYRYALPSHQVPLPGFTGDGDDRIVSVDPVGEQGTRCIGIPSGVFLAGSSMMPTGNCGKALDVSTPILTGDGWKKMGDIQVGDYVHAVDGSLTRVSFVSERHHDRDCFAVKFADKAELVASDHHLWAVWDRRLSCERVIDTRELYETQIYGRRGDRRYRVCVPDALDRPHADLPMDPYIFGLWLGDGSSYKAEFTSADPEVWDAIEAAGYTLTYKYPTGKAFTRGVLAMLATLKEMGVVKNKHVPDSYLLASQAQRLALLQGLMDSDGCALKGTTPRVEFTSTKLPLAEAVLFLARSLGWKANMIEGRATIYGRDCGPKYRVTWTACSDFSPFRLARKSNILAPAPRKPTRSRTNAVVSVEPVPAVETVCIQVEHPSHVFLAGESLTPTHNTEVLAGIMLYLLIGDGEASAEVYGVARDIKQAKLAFDVASQMVMFSPVLSKRLKVSEYKKRIYDVKTHSFYEVIAADAKSALGSNPSGVGADEILAWQSGDMWSSLRTGMGSGARLQPLMVASTTAGNDSEGFAGQMHKQMEKVLENPDAPENHHIFVYMRNTPKDADPWDEKNWWHANPALGDFLSLESLRKQAAEARTNPIEEMAFRQYRLNQWQSSTVRWMNMFNWNKNSNRDVIYPDNQTLLDSFVGCDCYFGLDLAAKQDLCSICYLFPCADPTYGVDVAWRHWICEAGLERLDRLNSGRFTAEFAKNGWLTVTPGNVLDFEVLYEDIKKDSQRYYILGGDVDRHMSEPVIQRIRLDTGISGEQVYAYDNTFATMSDGMHRIYDMVTDGVFRHHGNPLARFCFDACEARYKSTDPDQIMPDKPNRMKAAKRIDAVPAAIMAVNAWWTRDGDVNSVYNTKDVLVI